MNLNPVSPFSNRTLDHLAGEHAREGDAWCARLLGWTCVEVIKVPHRLYDYLGNITSEEGDELAVGQYKGTAQHVPHYHSDWAAAGPLMEREEMRVREFRLQVSRDDNATSIYDLDDTSGVGDSFNKHTKTLTHLIRDWFIIAAAGKE